MRTSGSAPWESRSASAAHTGTWRGCPPGGAQSTSSVDGPWAGLKKHGGRRTGSARPSTRARTHATAYLPSSSASVTCRTSSERVSRVIDSLADS